MNVLDKIMLNAMLYAAATPAAGTSGGSSIGTFIQSMGKNIGSWVKMFVMIVGVVMVGAGIYQLAKNLISHGKGQTNWLVTIALIIIGAILMLTGGWQFIKDFSTAGKKTLDDAAKGQNDVQSLQDSDFTIIFE